jgi:hypothetical protein
MEKANMELQTLTYQPIDKETLAEKGEMIFRSIEEKLKPEHLGKMVAVEVGSGDFFLGRTGSEAVGEAKKKHPNKIFYLPRVGSRAAVSFRGNLCSMEGCNGKESFVKPRFILA